MSTPRDPWMTPQPDRNYVPSQPYGPDEPTILTRPLSAHDTFGRPEARAEDLTLYDVTDPAMTVVRPPTSPTDRTPSSTLAQRDHPTARTRKLQSQEVTMLIGGVALFLTLVLVVTALLLRPILSIFPSSSPGHPIAASTPTPLPTVTPSPSPTATPTLPTTAATFAALDSTTQGNWQGAYGSAGYVVAGDATQQLPASLQVAASGASPFTWADSTGDGRAPVKPENPADRIAACWYSPTSFTIDVNITDGQTYQLALYVLDWDQQNRVETVSVIDPSSGAALDTRPVSAFGNGEYLVWQVRGHVTIEVINAAGSLNAVVSGLFFAVVASP